MPVRMTTWCFVRERNTKCYRRCWAAPATMTNYLSERRNRTDSRARAFSISRENRTAAMVTFNAPTKCCVVRMFSGAYSERQWIVDMPDANHWYKCLSYSLGPAGYVSTEQINVSVFVRVCPAPAPERSTFCIITMSYERPSAKMKQRKNPHRILARSSHAYFWAGDRNSIIIMPLATALYTICIYTYICIVYFRARVTHVTYSTHTIFFSCVLFGSLLPARTFARVCTPSRHLTSLGVSRRTAVARKREQNTHTRACTPKRSRQMHGSSSCPLRTAFYGHSSVTTQRTRAMCVHYYHN